MKAAIRRSYGSPDVIRVEEIDQPIPEDDEILIRVHATTVNRKDCANLTGKPFIMHFFLGFFRPRKVVLGTDFACEVVKIGKNIRDFEVNQRVFGFTDMGLESQAEYMVLKPKDNILSIPYHINYRQAAASLEGAHYAYTFIHKTNIQSGQRILINGASGAIGSALLQFVKTMNLYVTATCNSKNMELIRSLGADKVYDYTKEDFTMDDDTYDFIFDSIGKSTFGKCKHLLNKGGIYISSELGPYSQNIFLALFMPLIGDKKVIFPVPYSLSKTLPYIKSLIESRKFKPLIDREYPLSAIDEAYDYVLSGQKTGNVIINI